jgi:hypothetical protein
MSKKISVEMTPRQAAAVRQSLFVDTKNYTYNPSYVPERVTEIRDVILSIDEQLEEVSKQVDCPGDCPPGTVYIDGECADL